MNLVAFQYLSSAVIIFFLLLGFYLHKKNKLGFWYLGAFLTVLFISEFVYFNFTNSDKRIKVEKANSNLIFQKKLDDNSITKVKEFNYSEEFENSENSITKEADSIHKSIK